MISVKIDQMIKKWQLRDKGVLTWFAFDLNGSLISTTCKFLLCRSCITTHTHTHHTHTHTHTHTHIYMHIYITSQRGSAWHRYIGPLLSLGKMQFSTSRLGETNEYFLTKLGRRDYVSEIYKLTEFGEDRFRNGASTWWWNMTVLWLSSSAFFYFYFFPFPRPAHRSQFWSELHA